ncbi:MAG: DUF4397 domain-containing protein [Alkalimonas sp.]|nr:DUF4397 domain-containing protein [Alkalimonas sp.]
MKGLTRLAISAAMVSTLAACNSSSSDDSSISLPPVPPERSAELRVIHAVSDAPAVDIRLAGTDVVQGLDYAESSEKFTLIAANYAVEVRAILPGGERATVIGPATVGLTSQTDHKVFAVGSAADGTIEPLIIADSKTSLASGNIRLQVVHASSAAPDVDIHVTAPGDALSAPIATLGFKDYTAPIDVPAGDYQVRITLPGQDTVVFDSGPLDLAAGTDLVVAAINNRFAGDSPVSLLAVTPDGNFFDVMDANSKAAVRVVHGVSDAPAVDVLVNDEIRLVEDLAFPDFTGYLNVDPAEYNVKVAAHADNSIVAIDADLDLAAGVFYSVLALGSLGEEEITPLVLLDQPRRVATEAKVRIIHGSFLAPEVDIYVTETADISEAEPAFSEVPFLAETGYVSLAAGSYVVSVTVAGTKDVAIGPVTLDLEANTIYTAIARDGDGLTADFGLILMDDFVQQD